MRTWQVWPIRNHFYTRQDAVNEFNDLWQLVTGKLMRTRNEQGHKSEADCSKGREGLKNLNKWRRIVVLVAAFFTSFRSVNRAVPSACGTEDSVQSSKPCLPLRKIPELRSCVKVKVDVLVSPSLIVRAVSVDVQQHLRKIYKLLLWQPCSLVLIGGTCDDPSRISGLQFRWLAADILSRPYGLSGCKVQQHLKKKRKIHTLLLWQPCSSALIGGMCDDPSRISGLQFRWIAADILSSPYGLFGCKVKPHLKKKKKIRKLLPWQPCGSALISGMCNDPSRIPGLQFRWIAADILTSMVSVDVK